MIARIMRSAPSMSRSNLAGSRRGMAYVAVLVLLIILSTLGLAFIHKAGIEAAATMSRGEGMQADYLAEAAANHAMWRLLNEPDFPDDEQTYYMHTFGGGRYGYKVRRHTDTTFATVACVGAIGDHVAKQSYVLYVKLKDPVIFTAYDTDVNASDKIPKYRPFNDPGWDPEADTVDVGHRKVNWLELEGCGIRQEFVMATLDGANDITLAVWDGTSWGNQMEFATISNASFKCFNIAYESQSGDALILGRANTSSTPKYTIWDGTSWLYNPPINSIDTGGSKIRLVVMAANPFTDEILIAIVDWGKRLDLFQWDGNSFTHLGTIENAVKNSTQHIVDVVYEQQSGDAMIVWGKDGSSTCKFTIWDGSSLTPSADLPSFGVPAEQLLASADPTSDHIIVAAIDNGSDLNIAAWDGDAWIDARELDTSVKWKDKQDFDVEWESSGDEAVVAWRTSSDTQLRYYQWEKAGPGGAAQNGPDFAGGIATVQMLPVSGADKLALVACDVSGDLYYSLWDGDDFVHDPPILISNDISAIIEIAYDLAETRN